ncbi:selenoprotein M [Patella vulgata]|uniref:selenoprotein M n=1 Tax=Patella vulgata TaxID=6465 RepID=UPI0021803D2F|nr:selenoprotein M [Patella vulgata]
METVSISYAYKLFIAILVFIDLSFTHEPIIDKPVRDRDIMSARVESCGGCKVNRLKHVKRFIENDVALFHNVKLNRIHGANPDLVFLNRHGEVVERVDLTPYNQKELNLILVRKGFYKRTYLDEEVPERFQTGPYGVRRKPKFQIDIDDGQDLYVGQAKDVKPRRDEL